MTRFVLGTSSLIFNCDPTRAGGESPKLFQASGRAGDGALYVYSKSSLQRTTHRLHLPRINTETRAALLVFFKDQAQGTKNTFYWFDHQDIARQVRFSDPRLKIVAVGAEHYAVDISLTEDSA